MARTRSPRRKTLRKSRPGLSSTSLLRRRAAAVVLGGVAAVATLAFVHKHHEWPAEAEAATYNPPQLSPDQEVWYRGRLGLGAPASTALPAADPLAEAILTWRRLMASGTLPFADYAGFLQVHPGWPGEAQLRRAAERAIGPDTPPQSIASYFSVMPPTTNTGEAKLALALAQLGKRGDAQAAAEAAWTGGTLSAADEAALGGQFRFGQTAQDQRMEKLLWQHAGPAAGRQLALVSPARRGLYSARLALQTNTPDAAAQGEAAGPNAGRDAGFLLDRAHWLSVTGHVDQARLLLATPVRLDAPPFDPQAWLTGLLAFATDAKADGDMATAAAIARLALQTYPSGVQPRDRPLAERDPYTSLVWAGGQAALLGGRPQEAMPLFEAYATAARSPVTQSKGLYWAGRAAIAAGNGGEAQRFFKSGAAFTDQFYGQLAAERAGQALPVPPPLPDRAAPKDRQAAFSVGETVRAARMLGELGDWQDQSIFLRTIAQSAQDDTDHLMIAQLSRDLGRPDLGVMVSRVGRQSGASDYVASGFPTIPVPASDEASWTMIHAISRQESQFDRQATSRVGAKGLMQLMPATAREEAGRVGVAWDPARLIDPEYNVMLGSDFFGRLMTRYNGNYVLAVAAYNAGPGNVNKFIAKNGDPRAPGADVVAWIEAIPLTETRGYVQHVLENAVVYDLLNPDRARMPATNRLSAYLGKSQPG